MSTWVGSNGVFATATQTLSLTLPAGWQPGDLAILVASNDAGTDPAWAAPAGWTLRGHTAATNMHSYIWSRVLQAGDSTVALQMSSGTFAVGVWRDAVLGTVGTFGIKAGTWAYAVAPDIAATGYRAHIYAERSTAATAGEADVLHSLTYGTARSFYGGNPALSAANGISAVYFSDSAPGQSGANTATFVDSSANGWGIQLDLGPGAPANPKIETLTDSFDTSLDKAVKWTDTSTATVWDSSGRAKIPCVTNYWNLGTPGAGTYDLTDSSVYAKITPPAVGNGSRETFMEIIRGGANDKLTIGVSGGNLAAWRRIGGTTSGTSTIGAYNPTTHAWWRIRESGGTTYFDYSADGVTWTNGWSVANGFNVTKVWLNFSSGYWGTESAADTFIDNVNVVPVATTKITVKAIGATALSTTTSLVLPAPAADTGNYLVAVMASQAYEVSKEFTPPAGWTKLNVPYVQNVQTRTLSMFGLALSGAPESSYTFTTPLSGSRHLGFIVALNNVDLANPLVEYSPMALPTSGNSASTTVPQFSADYFLMEMWAAQFSSPNSYAQASYSGALTLAVEAYSPAGAENTGVSRTALRLWMGQPGAGGNPAHTTVTVSTATGSGASQIALRAGTATPPPAVGMAIKVSTGAALRDTRLQVSDGTKLYTPRGIKKVPNGYPSVTAMLDQPSFYCGHRGGSRDFPEMSAYGYGQAVLRDYGMLELSLARTSDGVWFGLHDASLDRTSLGTGGGSGTTLVASSMTWAQVQGYQIKGSMAANNPTQPDRPYMRFEELVAVYYHSHIILVDIKYATAYTAEFLNKLDALPGNPRERIMGKSFGVSGAADNSSGFAKNFADRGYRTWGYFYESNQADFVTYAPRWSILGMDYTASQASWDALKAAAPGKIIMGHICETEAAVTTAKSKGAKGFQVSSPVNVKPAAIV